MEDRTDVDIDKWADAVLDAHRSGPAGARKTFDQDMAAWRAERMARARRSHAVFSNLEAIFSLALVVILAIFGLSFLGHF